MNIPLTKEENLPLIKNLIWWFKNQLEELGFINTGLYPDDLIYLF